MQDLSADSPNFSVRTWIKAMDEARGATKYAIERGTLINQEKQLTRARPTKIVPGSVVVRRKFMKDIRSPQPYKLQPLYDGPFLVTKVISGIAYYLDPHTPTKEMHLSVDHLFPIDSRRMLPPNRPRQTSRATEPSSAYPTHGLEDEAPEQ